jgi:hypothetical protein
MEGPSVEVVEAVHREAHGNVASRVIEVDRGKGLVELKGFDEPMRVYEVRWSVTT